jgi:hypothetical protein
MTSADEEAWYVRTPYATFLLVAAAGRVTRAPPIARWTIGKQTERVLAHDWAKGGRIEAANAPAQAKGWCYD